MVLQLNRRRGADQIVPWKSATAGLTNVFSRVVQEDAVVNDGYERGAGQFSIKRKLGGLKQNVIDLPFAWLAARVDHGRILAVQGTRLPVGIGSIVVRIQHLNFEFTHEVNAAIAASLAVAFGLCGRLPFDVKLAGTKVVDRVERTGSWGDFEVAVFNLPLCFQ